MAKTKSCPLPEKVPSRERMQELTELADQLWEQVVRLHGMSSDLAAAGDALAKKLDHIHRELVRLRVEKEEKSGEGD